MKIIDCHVNLGTDTSNLRKNMFPSEQTYGEHLKNMNKIGIIKSIVLPFPIPSAKFNKNMFWYEFENHYLIQAANFSDKFIPFPAVNPNDEYSVKNIKTLSIAHNIKGIKISHHIPMEFSVEKLINHPLMKIVQENNLIVMIHTGTGKEPQSKIYHETLNYGIKVAKHYPDVNFIFCHLGRLHAKIIDALHLKNVYMDTSAISMINYSRDYIALEPLEMLKMIGPSLVIEKLVSLGFENKIIFGSDVPYVLYKAEIDAIKDAKIPELAKEKIFYNNIAKLLKLK